MNRSFQPKMWSSLASCLPLAMLLHSAIANCNCNKQQPHQPDQWTFNSLPTFPNDNQHGLNLNNNNFGGLNNGGIAPGVGDLHSFNLNNNNNNGHIPNGPVQLPNGNIHIPQWLLGGTHKNCCGRCNCNNNQGNKNNGNTFGGFNLGNNHGNTNNGGVWTENIKFGKASRGSSFPETTGNGVPITEFGINGGLTSSNGFPSQGETYSVLSGNFGGNTDNHGIPVEWNSNFANNGHSFGNQNGGSNGFPYLIEKLHGKRK